MNDHESKVLRRVVAHAKTGIFKPFSLLGMTLELKPYGIDELWCLDRINVDFAHWSRSFVEITRENIYRAACELAVKDVLEQ